jgi:hypothetical protein
MDNGNGLSVADVAAMNGGGFGNGIEGLLYLAVIAFMFGGGNIFGGGGVNGNANAIQNDINRGFDNQNLQAQTRDLTAAVNAQGAAAIAATNQTFHDSLAAMQNLYNETSRDIAALAVGQANLQASQAQCCCETKQLIMQNNYDGALRDAATNANFTAQIQGVKDMLAQNKIEALQSQVNALTLQNALAGVVRYPTATMYAVPSPCFPGGCPCNQ